jgi:hypothetical protein
MTEHASLECGLSMPFTTAVTVEQTFCPAAKPEATALKNLMPV